MIKVMYQMLIEVIKVMYQMLIEVIKMIDQLTEVIKMMYQMLIDVIKVMYQMLIDALKMIDQMLIDVIKVMYQMLIEVIKMMYQMLIEVIKAMYQMLINVISSSRRCEASESSKQTRATSSTNTTSILPICFVPLRPHPSLSLYIHLSSMAETGTNDAAPETSLESSSSDDLTFSRYVRTTHPSTPESPSIELFNDIFDRADKRGIVLQLTAIAWHTRVANVVVGAQMPASSR